MELIKLAIKNFLSISNVEIVPGKINQIIGCNNTGKTSILRAIEVGMKGSPDSSVVKVGETQAEIILEFSDGMSVRRRINASGTQDVKVSKNEMEAKAPQTFLTSLFDKGSFNPLELLEAKQRTEALLQAVPVKITKETVVTSLNPLPIDLPPVDYSQHGLKVLDQLGQYFYARRAEANKKAKDEAARLKVEEEKLSSVEPEKATVEDAELDRKLGSLDSEARQIQQKRGENNMKVAQLKELERQTNQIQQVVLNLQKEQEKAQRDLEDVAGRADLLFKEVSAFENLDERLDKISGAKIRMADEKTKNANHRVWVAQKNNLDGQRNRLREANIAAEELDRCVNSLRGPIKHEMMDSTKMPIEGITYSDERFYFYGHAIDNLSTSATMKLAVELARISAKKAKIICLDGAECLDEENYIALKEEIQDDGYTYFISKVGEAFKNTGTDKVVRMENGVALQ